MFFLFTMVSSQMDACDTLVYAPILTKVFGKEHVFFCQVGKSPVYYEVNIPATSISTLEEITEKINSLYRKDHVMAFNAMSYISRVYIRNTNTELTTDQKLEIEMHIQNELMPSLTRMLTETRLFDEFDVNNVNESEFFWKVSRVRKFSKL